MSIQDQPVSPALLTVKATAATLGVGRSTIYDLLNAGELPSCRIGKSRRIPAAAITEYIASQLAASQAMA